MEPAAPGTEDDAVQPTLSKKASDDERLLSIKSQLPSGRYGNVFSKNYNDGMEQWYCNLCECPVMGRMFHHETGKRHTQQIGKMEQRQQRNKDRYGKEKVEDEKPEAKEEETLFREMGSGVDHAQINVAPGEPVPPGVDGDVTKVAQIQERLDKFKASALLGLEYLLEITDYDISKEPSYLCALCDKKGDPRTVIAHLVSYNHLQQFMQRHFPATYRALSPYITRQYRKNWQDTMNSIAEAIECKYGRLLPHPVDKDTFEKKKDYYYQVIHMGPHFSEKNGITFEHMVKPEEITKNIEDDNAAHDLKAKLPAKKRSPSPPVVAKPKRVRSNPDNIRGRRNSLSSVSSISSNEMNEGGSADDVGGGRDMGGGGGGWRRSPRGARGRGRAGRGGTIRRRVSRSASGSANGSPDRRNEAGRNSRSRSKSRSRYQNTHNPRYNHPHRGQSFRGGYQTNRGGAYNLNRYNNNNNNNSGNYRRSLSPRPRSPRSGGDRRSRSPRNRNDNRPPWERSNYSARVTNRSPPPTGGRGGEISRTERAKVERESKVEEYSRLCKAIDNDMGRVLKGHEKNPEKHPQYNEEWKLFWNRRYKELQVEGKDAANYDFKPEWIIVWNKRMMELHNADIKIKKDGLRKRLGLREEPAPISFRIGRHSPSSSSKGPAPVAAQPDQDHEVIIIDDKDDDIPKASAATRKTTAVVTPSASNKVETSPARSHSPWETDVPPASAPPVTKAGGKKTADDEFAPKKGADRLERSAEKSSSRSRDEQIRRSSPSSDYPPRRPRASRERSIERFLDRDRKRSPLVNRERDTRDTRGGNPAIRDRERVIGLERDGRDSRDRERRYDDGARFDSRERDGRRSREDAAIGNWERRGGGLVRSRSPRSRTPSSPTDRERYYREREREYFERERSWERVINRHREMRMVPPIPDVYRPPIIMRDVTSAPMHYLPANMMPMQQRPPSPEIDIPDEALSIVSVLRLLTALEETLGSLGPKVIDLLTSALALEKNEPNSAEILLDNEINCVMFETVKEKLKGRLQAGLVTYKQEKAVKHAIKNLASLIHDASERKRIRIQQAALNPLTVPGVGVVDKAAIAKQIATALVLQGKTDVSQGELEQLINAVVGMAEASRNLETPMNTATFLTKCREKTPEFTPKIIIPTILKEREKEREKERIKLEQQIAQAATNKTEDPVNTSIAKADDENSAMEGLSDSDLQTLLQNFKDLSTDEQHGLISYLKKLEAREPQRVEKLRQFVNMGKSDSAGDDPIKSEHDIDEITLKRFDCSEDQGKMEYDKINFDSDEEDYTYEDVFKVAKQNVTKKEKEEEEEKARRKAELEEEEKKNMEINLDQAKMIIANLMGTISKAADTPQTEFKPSNLLGFITNTANALDDHEKHTPFESPPAAEYVDQQRQDPSLVNSNIATQKKQNVPDRPSILLTQPGPGSGNSNDGRTMFEPHQQIQMSRAALFDDTLRGPFDAGHRLVDTGRKLSNRDPEMRLNSPMTTTGASSNSEMRLNNPMTTTGASSNSEMRLNNPMSSNANFDPSNRDSSANPMSKMTGGNFNHQITSNAGSGTSELQRLNNNPFNPSNGGRDSEMRSMNANMFDFQPPLKSAGGIPPPPPQPPFQGGNPFGMISYPGAGGGRNYHAGDSVRFGGFSSDPSMRGGAPFNPFADGARGGGFNMNNESVQRGAGNSSQHQQQQSNSQRGGYDNRW